MNQRGMRKIVQTRRNYSVYKNSMLKCTQTFNSPIECSRKKGVKKKINKSPSSPTNSQSPFSQAPEVVIRRDFRINGQIGKLGQKDKLSYTNLMHQIETGKCKGHNDAEIAEAMVRAATPGLSLRDMLESKII